MLSSATSNTGAGLIVPEDRNVAFAHLNRAKQGDGVVHEFRIQRPSDQAFRWIKDTAFPLLDAQVA
ncbi:PAS domain-containing protein [Bradyrhizobium jicamae]|uniref:PAS domain-containing protein n=1 Tax=Bradyrhizobium jicamae TaxID=280332 RepID=A0ABS5FQ73_9BRAD|nr:PAS domain-containing protein [Bradyrhizobium jicamae]